MNAEAGLFSTVPLQDPLGFWGIDGLEVRRVIEFLRLTRADVAHLSGLARSTIRFDSKMPRELRETFQEIAATITEVAEFFNGDAVRTELWFTRRNPLLGGITPREMIRAGRFETLRRFIQDARSQNPAGEGGAMAPLSRTFGKDYLRQHRPELEQLCRRFGVRRLAAFGSATRPDFEPASSDIDLVVEFTDIAGLSPARQYFDFKQALETLFHRTVDLVELSAMPDSRLKRAIVRSQVPLYGEAA